MPRAGLDGPRVVALALEVLDAGGVRAYDDLTLSAVAARAGVAVPSLYKHVRGLPGLRTAVAAVCIDDLTAALAVDGGAGRPVDAVRRLAVAMREFALAHPGRYGATQGSWAQDPTATLAHAAGARTVRLITDVLSGAGVSDEHVVDATRAFRAAVHGFVLLELGGGFGMADPVDESFDYLVDRLVAGLADLPAARSNDGVRPVGR